VVESIGADAAGDLTEQAQIGLDHRRFNVQSRVEWRMAGAAKRRIGNTGQAQFGGFGQRHRPALIERPEQQNQQTQRQPAQNQGAAPHGDRFL
jgi:hypothetical protein